MINKKVLRGDVFYTNLPQTVGSEQGRIRPVVVIQNNTGNKFSPTIVVAVLTNQKSKKSLPTHVEVNVETRKGMKNSTILLEQIKTIDKKRLLNYVCSLDEEEINRMDYALKVSLNLLD